MKISQVARATKIADFVLNDNADQAHKFISANKVATREILNDNRARVYFIVIDGEIVKIGGSSMKGGVSSVINTYTTGLSGDPTNVRVLIPMLIARALKNGSTAEFYAFHIDNVEIPVFSLSGETLQVVPASHKSSEDACVREFFQVEGTNPIFNFQESGTGYNDPAFEAVFNFYQDTKRNKMKLPYGGKQKANNGGGVYEAYSTDELAEFKRLIEVFMNAG